MFNAITHHQVWVLDQDEALDFYVGKLGLEVHTDVQMEVMRWLTVHIRMTQPAPMPFEPPSPSATA